MMIRFDGRAAAILLALAGTSAMLAQRYEIPAGMLQFKVPMHRGRFDELPSKNNASYKLHSVWASPFADTPAVQSSEPLDVQLSPFEMLTFEANPLP